MKIPQETFHSVEKLQFSQKNKIINIIKLQKNPDNCSLWSVSFSKISTSCNFTLFWNKYSRFIFLFSFLWQNDETFVGGGTLTIFGIRFVRRSRVPFSEWRKSLWGCSFQKCCQKCYWQKFKCSVLNSIGIVVPVRVSKFNNFHFLSI